MRTVSSKTIAANSPTFALSSTLRRPCTTYRLLPHPGQPKLCDVAAGRKPDLAATAHMGKKIVEQARHADRAAHVGMDGVTEFHRLAFGLFEGRVKGIFDFRESLNDTAG